MDGLPNSKSAKNRKENFGKLAQLGSCMRGNRAHILLIELAS